jgi:hypothetical protein
MDHAWSFEVAQFGGSITGFAPWLVAVCSRCGEIRSVALTAGGGTKQINLEGDCPKAEHDASETG